MKKSEELQDQIEQAKNEGGIQDGMAVKIEYKMGLPEMGKDGLLLGTTQKAIYRDVYNLFHRPDLSHGSGLSNKSSNSSELEEKEEARTPTSGSFFTGTNQKDSTQSTDQEPDSKNSFNK